MDEPRHFVAESYQHGDAAQASGRAARAACALRRRGRRIRHLWSLEAPEEEICLHLFETSSAEVVAELAAEAALSFDRVWAAVPLDPLTPERRAP